MSRHVPLGSAPAPGPEKPDPDSPHEAERPVGAEPSRASTFLALVVVYVLGLGAVMFVPAGSEVPVWWPVAGVAAAFLALAPRRWQWLLALGVAAATGLAVFTAERSPVSALGVGLSSGAEAYVVAWLLSRGRRTRPALRTMEDLWRLLVATLAGSALAAVGIGLTVVYGLDGSFVVPALAVLVSHAAAILVIVPFAMRVGPSAATDKLVEAVAQWVLLLGAVGYVFSPGQELSLAFLPLPLLLWGALRFGLRTVSYQLVAVGVVAGVLTALGGGPFAVEAQAGVTTAAGAATLTQAFVLVAALVALPLAVAMDQRRTALVRVTQNEELFHKAFSESFVGMLLLYLSPDGLRVRELNQTAADILGGPIDTFVDHPLQQLVESSTVLKDVAAQMVAGDLPGWREEVWLTTEPGRRVGLAVSPMSTTAEEPMFSAQLMDVTDVYVATTRLQTEKDFTAAVLGTTACLIVVVDIDGKITGLNPAGEKVTGFSEEELLDQPLWGTLAPATDKRDLRDLLDRTRPGRETPSLEGDLRTAQGGLRRIVWASAPLTNESGRRTHVVLTGIDVTEERNARSMAGHLLDAATSTAFIALDLGGTVTIFNTGAQELLGYTADEVKGRMRLDALHDPGELTQVARRQGTEPGFATVIAGVETGPQTRDWTYVRKDGSRVACAVTMSVVRDAFGSHIGYLAVGRDVTESQRSQMLLVETLEKERQAVERLRELDRVKDDFVAMVSNELRSPITTMVGYTEMLEDGAAGPLSREQKRLLDMVRRNGERLVTLIEDLLVLSRIDSGTLTMERKTVDLRTIFDRAHERVDPMLVGRDLDIQVDLPGQPVVVVGDAAQLERVVVNLLSNAVKFTEDGGRVQWSLTASDSVAEIVVSDTGIGIPEAEQPALFTRFFRSSTTQERAIQGTGLGLSIVQSIVQSHGGQVWIRSEDMAGTEAHVVLPLTASPQRPPSHV
ncbi:MAG TPA: PAS domain S-box protein [Nocardioidaceae bacterium]